jgi:hypothetical protein
VLDVRERRKKKIIPLKHRWNEDKEKRENWIKKRKKPE